MKNKEFNGFNSKEELVAFTTFFKFTDFDSPDQRGSGELTMDRKFLSMLVKARQIANVPFRINSGHRTLAYNNQLIKRGYKASPVSSHIKGVAVDLGVKNNAERFFIVKALMDAGFNRIGIGNTFVHVDLDNEKPKNVIWTY